MYAAESGACHLVQLLLRAGADANAHDAWGKTPLMHVCEYGDALCVVDTLLAAGANAATVDRNGRTAWMYAVDQKAPSTVVARLRGETQDSPP